MRFLSLRLQRFRNLSAVEMVYEAGPHFLHAPNGQGKTNLLEALGFLSALRSFRGADRSTLIQQGTPSAALRYTVEHERWGETNVAIDLLPGRATVQTDGGEICRYADHLGRFPTVAMGSQDLQLLRGGPEGRRRYLDLLLSSVDPSYLLALRVYHAALKSRNALLKQNQPAGAEWTAFEIPMAEAAAQLAQSRARTLTTLSSHLQKAYSLIATAAEQAELVYEPNCDASAQHQFRHIWEQGRARDQFTGSTSRGPHRDDWALRLMNMDARGFASEGQQRGLVLALRLAEAELLHSLTGIVPVILADDVLGELDPVRRQAFWNGLPKQTQIIATGTASPESSRPWHIWKVQAGRVSSPDHNVPPGDHV